ncbi:MULTISPECIES: LrgB family protein [Brucella]|uniref:LrgB family protein n=1 Tax=Brucella anthropi (strain ATCC 49188 / DSM 6882 / CCUG 24695 / JCM 21032 / LMG 3331 / NBRC 15819 / NCTC 12168 / Alc 37) TaxID=439375 RepID=A6WVZ9_BRUA4|nr:LrgB family protein [Brucella anthropi]ABS13153.1 LrgB family protein [Brucella anthropi ATCC 49188]KAB2763892.1 LrgB family protein [Brucella anthropi]KAB2779611.1 LrgB family protein [Brucella anthropi]QQC24604.1 LrgB family protein [Brucella anthropi]RRY20812.1 LrgB family protein [Brucella anthropi]
MSLSNPLVATLFWSAATILLYLAAKRVYRRFPMWWLTPLVVTPLLLIALVIGLNQNYRGYFGATHWLVALLGPATVAFAVPIYQQRATIRRYWPVLLAGVVVGSSSAMASAWGLAHLLGLNEAISLSLMPRSMSTPFAMTVSGDIGGAPDLTAIFVVLTGVFGAALGEVMLNWLPIRSALARGALFGMGAHGAGVAKAHQIGSEEGSIAGLVMVLVGLVNVLAAPLIAHFL